MPGFPTPNSGGFAEKAPGGSAKSKIPGKAAYGGQSGGQVMISGPEEKALRVLELDDPMDPNDDSQLIMQAAAESGLPEDRVVKLKARAESARNKGMTLKGPTITFQPINPMAEDGLLGDDVMADVGGEMGPDGLGPEMNPEDLVMGAGRVGPAGAGAGNPADGRMPTRNLPPDAQGQQQGGKPMGGPLATGATMSSAGLSNQRFAPPWRPGMSQATIAPPRMTPDLNRPGAMTPSAAQPGVPGKPAAPGAPPMGSAPGVRPGMPPVAGVPTGAPQRGAGYPPARPPVPPRPMSGGNRFGKTDARDPRLAAAYARESVAAVEECDECGGTCGGKKKGHRRY